jgi:hypothetical protein
MLAPFKLKLTTVWPAPLVFAIWIIPLALPHVAFVVVRTAEGWGFNETVVTATVKHPFASVTVHEYVPFASPLKVAPAPATGDHEYVYPGVPPEAVTVADPALNPEHVPAEVIVVLGGGFI